MAPHRYKDVFSPTHRKIHFVPFFALWKKFKEGYSSSDLRSDAMSGIIVGLVAMPLGMALAIACGVPPQNGLYTVIIGGLLIALLGGSRFQVSGPTAAFVVILAPIVHKFGLQGLLIAGFLSGFILFFMGLAGLGRLIQFIPYPVTTGFTSGIAVVIASLQFKDFLGLQFESTSSHFAHNISAMVQSFNTLQIQECAVGIVALLLLVFWPKINKKIPSPIIALTTVTLATIVMSHFYPGITFTTIKSKFGGIPQALPSFHVPWYEMTTSGDHVFSLKTIEALIPSAFAIAMLGAIESLLSAVIADGMTQSKHDPDTELCALGIGNMLCPFFGGIAATGAIARTATNIRYGAKSPISAIIHALFALLCVLLFAPYISLVPMAALAALLLVVAFNMSEINHVKHMFLVAPITDVIIFSFCFSLTVMFDMVIGVSVGIVLAALMFMKRMSDFTSGQVLLKEQHKSIHENIPHDHVVYEIAGPLFFGAAEKAVESITSITDESKTIVFLMQHVPLMDMTGLVAFESTLQKLYSKGKTAYLVGVQKQPLSLLKKSTFVTTKNVRFFEKLHDAFS